MCLKLKKLCVHTFDLFYEVWHLSLQPPYSSEVTLLSPWKTGCQPSHVTALHSSQSLPVWSPSSTKIRVCWDILEGDCPALTLHVSWAPNTSLMFNHCVGLQFLLWNLCRVKLKKGGGVKLDKRVFLNLQTLPIVARIVNPYFSVSAGVMIFLSDDLIYQAWLLLLVTKTFPYCCFLFLEHWKWPDQCCAETKPFIRA